MLSWCTLVPVRLCLEAVLPLPLCLQLPVLRDLQRVVDELAFGVNNTQQPVGTPSRLIAEQVPTLRAALLRRGGWEALAARQAAAQFGAEAQRLSQQRLESMLASFELMCNMEEGGARQQEVGGQSALGACEG
jgi:hypothetical protein